MQKPDIGNAHAAIDRLAHVVNCQRGDRRGGQRLHLHPGAPDQLAGGGDIDRDLVRQTLGGAGMAPDFWRIAMRPGKPLMFGRLEGAPVLGLPGNPVSALVCALVFLRPALARLSGLDPDREDARLRRRVALARALPANDRREDYLRSRLSAGPDGAPRADPFPVQDSSMLAPLARADALVVRPPHAPAAAAGETAQAILLRGGGDSLF